MDRYPVKDMLPFEEDELESDEEEEGIEENESERDIEDDMNDVIEEEADSIVGA